MDKTVLTLDEVLDRYFFKEWGSVGETLSGDKDELIERFLNSRKIRRRSVEEIAVDLISSLRMTELKQMAEDLETQHKGKRGQILKGILNSVVFEPFVKNTTRYCSVCLSETAQELHFGVDWQADYFKCEICGGVSSVRSIEDEDRGDQSTPQQVIDARWTGPIQVAERKTNVAGEQADVVESPSQGPAKSEEGHSVGKGIAPENERDSISQQALAWAIALGGVGVFLAVSIPIGLAYGWIVGLACGIASTILAGVLLISSRRYWVRGLLRLVR
jgi:hypothetical protein